MNYEITFITEEEDDSGPIKTIQDLDGEIINVKSLGRLKFSYPISQKAAGYYTAVSFNVDRQKQAELIKRLRSISGLIRFLIVTIPLHKLTKPVQFREQLKEAKELEVSTADVNILTPTTGEKLKTDVTPTEEKLKSSKKVKRESVDKINKGPIATEDLDQDRAKKLDEHLDKILGHNKAQDQQHKED